MSDYQMIMDYWNSLSIKESKNERKITNNFHHLIASQLNYAALSKQISSDMGELLIWENLKQHESNVDITTGTDSDYATKALNLSSRKQDGKLWKSSLCLSDIMNNLPDRMDTTVFSKDTDINLIAKHLPLSFSKNNQECFVSELQPKFEKSATSNSLKRNLPLSYCEMQKRTRLMQSYNNTTDLQLCENQEPSISQSNDSDIKSVVTNNKVDAGKNNSNCISFVTAKQQLFKDQQKRIFQPNSKSVLTRNRSNHSSLKQNATISKPALNNQSETENASDKVMKHIDPKMVDLMLSEIMDQGPPVTWDDIAGLEFAKKTIKEIVIWPMLRPDLFTGLRGPPKGVLLFGPPGTGKTLIGKCIASQTKSTFFSISASSLTSKWIGEGEKLVKALFAVARCHEPAVIFIDEIDSLLTQRSESEHESSRRIKTEFLVQLDGATTSNNEKLLLIGATNRPQELDEAIRRRLVKRLYIPLPEVKARIQIIKTLLKTHNHILSDEDFINIGNNTEGYSGSDMANLCKEAALGPLRKINFSDIEHIREDEVKPIDIQDFLDALNQVKASVSEKDMQTYLEWNEKFGSCPISKI